MNRSPKAMTVQRSFPANGMAAVGLGGAWIAVAVAETLLIGGQDALNDVGMIGENYLVITIAGMLHWAAALSLTVGLVGVAPLIWASRIGRIGWSLTTALAAGLSAFAMVHLLALETAAAGLDGPAMNQFLVERLGDGTGPWVIPIFFVALVGPWSFALLLFGLVRVRRVHWISPVVFVIGALIHLLFAAEILESLSVWVMAAGGMIAAYGILRSRDRVGDDAGAANARVRESDDLRVGGF
ncbi:hypothetical protein [Homoserinimonas sp. OAct 916]|uniref:hypothetical protein n=1 Tax=Homoserinimonas sp. OAct 916 TaxID=2211450 RepID=UPI00130059BE|nr:hypothetical protein [Homoserinimonas sp. OAct 916]